MPAVFKSRDLDEITDGLFPFDTGGRSDRFSFNFKSIEEACLCWIYSGDARMAKATLLHNAPPSGTLQNGDTSVLPVPSYRQ